MGQQENSGSEGKSVLIETRVGLFRQRHLGSMTWYQGQVGTATGSCGKGRFGSPKQDAGRKGSRLNRRKEEEEKRVEVQLGLGVGQNQKTSI